MIKYTDGTIGYLKASTIMDQRPVHDVILVETPNGEYIRVSAPPARDQIKRRLI